MVEVLVLVVLVGVTKKRFVHYAILKILSLRSPSTFSPSVPGCECSFVTSPGGGINGELFLGSFFKASYFGKLFR